MLVEFPFNSTPGVAPVEAVLPIQSARQIGLEQAEARAVDDVVFQKKRGLHVEEMAKSPWVYRKLRNFRAGIEVGISVMKRAYGWGGVPGKGYSISAPMSGRRWSPITRPCSGAYSRPELLAPKAEAMLRNDRFPGLPVPGQQGIRLIQATIGAIAGEWRR